MTDLSQPVETTAADTPRPFPFTRGCPFSPPAEYAELRETEPVSKVTVSVNGREAWLLTKYEDVRKVLGDRTMSSDMRLDGHPIQLQIPVELIKMAPPSLFNMDPPVHTAQRRLLMPEFTVKRIESLRPRFQEIVDEYLDKLVEAGKDGNPVDLVKALANPVPSLILCEMLGVPFEDHDFFRNWIQSLLSSATTPEQQGIASMEMGAYLEKLINGKRENPGEDIISRMLSRNAEEHLVEDQDISMLTRGLIAAGHTTTASMIAMGVIALLRHPEQLAELKADFSLMPQAVEELLRYYSVSDSVTQRVAMEDLEIGGVLIKAGEGIIASTNAADHDPEVFEEPNTLNIHRKPNGHVAFGYGIHQCGGQSLARMELEVVYTSLFKRIPDLRLAVPAEELVFRTESLIYGVLELPVTW
ncbi:cytochrome P450 [Kitasatospora sp. NPDC058965]|uniref:cytochrome P450 n=1 Tax=Kitasatospora sp. NPDC058965 TaxID=3346682 RepID=UPI00367D7DBD